jgi:hypothetical protein
LQQRLARFGLKNQDSTDYSNKSKNGGKSDDDDNIATRTVARIRKALKGGDSSDDVIVKHNHRDRNAAQKQNNDDNNNNNHRRSENSTSNGNGSGNDQFGNSRGEAPRSWVRATFTTSVALDEKIDLSTLIGGGGDNNGDGANAQGDSRGVTGAVRNRLKLSGAEPVAARVTGRQRMIALHSAAVGNIDNGEGYYVTKVELRGLKSGRRVTIEPVERVFFTN